VRCWSYEPYGLPELRRRIADRFTRRGLPSRPEQVLVTAGALHATSLALSVLVGPGDRVLVEDPGYPHAHDAVRALSARVVPVRVSAQAPEAVARDVHRAAREAAPRAAYLVPEFSNPTGLLLDDERGGASASASSSAASSPSSTRRSSTSGSTPSPARRWRRCSRRGSG
jgi:DNA-binding transcriptional MocR family regulator